MLVSTPGLLRPLGTDRYQFAHPLLRAYLAARQSAATPQEGLIERLDDPLWAEVLRFYAELGDVGPLVAEWLRRPDDLFRTRLHTLSRWIDAAPEGVDWRDGAMATLARGFLQPHLPLPVRQGLAEALAATGVSGVVYFFSQQIAEHPEANVRAAAIHGLAGIAGEPELPILETAMEDGAPPVRKAVVRALGRMRIDAATHWLGRILMAGDDVLSPIAAEALAESGEEGIALLRVAVETGEVLARRAAVLGLARAGARETLERVAHKEEQWIVNVMSMSLFARTEEKKSMAGYATGRIWPPRSGDMIHLLGYLASERSSFVPLRPPDHQAPGQ